MVSKYRLTRPCRPDPYQASTLGGAAAGEADAADGHAVRPHGVFRGTGFGRRNPLSDWSEGRQIIIAMRKFAAAVVRNFSALIRSAYTLSILPMFLCFTPFAKVNEFCDAMNRWTYVRDIRNNRSVFHSNDPQSKEEKQQRIVRGETGSFITPKGLVVAQKG